MEDRMGQESGRALQLVRQRLARLGVDLGIGEGAAEGAPDRFDRRRRRGLVERDAQAGVTDAEIDCLGRGARDDLGTLGAGIHADGVEEGVGLRRKAELAQAAGEHDGAAMDVARDLDEPLGAVIDRIHRRDHGEQHLRGADVGGRLLAADVLLAGLQCEAVGRHPARVDGEADDAAGQRALQRIAHRHIGRVRAAIAHGNAEALGRADRDIGAQLAGRGEQRQRQQVGGEDGNRTLRLQRRDGRTRITQCAGGARILQEPADDIGSFQVGRGIADDQGPAQRLGAGAHHSQRLRMHVLVDEEGFCLDLRVPLGERHGFGRRGRLIEQRGVGDVEPGEVADHGLEVEQRLQPALADLGLVGRVGRVPGRILQDVALDHRGQDRAGIALADQGGEDPVLTRELAHMRDRLGFAERLAEIERGGLPDRGRQRLRHQGVDAPGADGFEHCGDIARGRADVAAGERGGGVAVGLAVRGHHGSSL